MSLFDAEFPNIRRGAGPSKPPSGKENGTTPRKEKGMHQKIQRQTEDEESWQLKGRVRGRGERKKIHPSDEVRKGLVAEKLPEIEKKLQNAFRKGINVSVQGLLRKAPSDHLPIEVTFHGVSAASWNLLADVHLPNNLRNVTGTNAIERHLSAGNGYITRMHYFYSSFGEFLLKNHHGRAPLIVNQDSFRQFLREEEDQFNHMLVKLQEEQKLLTEPEAIEKINVQMERERKKFTDLREVVSLFQKAPEDSELLDTISFTIRHLIEITYSIKEGPMLWNERKKLIRKNKALLKLLAQKELLCFQECTNPQEILEIIRANAPKGRNFQMLKHRVVEMKGKEEGDWCVILYDANRYSCEEKHTFGLARNTKPCILAKFASVSDSSKKMLIGSVHLPGGKNAEMDAVIEQIAAFSNASNVVPPSTCIMGDFNHHEGFFAGTFEQKDVAIHTPKEGTMAGPDFGNTNQAIDGVLAEVGEKPIVSVIQAFQTAAPMQMPFSIEVNL